MGLNANLSSALKARAPAPAAADAYAPVVLLVDDEPAIVTASLGVAALAAGETGEGMVARADAALYRAKRSGRDRVVCAEEGAP